MPLNTAFAADSASRMKLRATRPLWPTPIAASSQPASPSRSTRSSTSTPGDRISIASSPTGPHGRTGQSWNRSRSAGRAITSVPAWSSCPKSKAGTRYAVPDLCKQYRQRSAGRQGRRGERDWARSAAGARHRRARLAEPVCSV